MSRFLCVGLWLAAMSWETPLWAETVFVEAEQFEAGAGWEVKRGSESRSASRGTTLWGANGPGEGVVNKTISLRSGGKYQVWVRSMQVGAWRGPFRLGVSSEGQELGAAVFDLDADPKVGDWQYGWHRFEAELPRGEVTLILSKHEQQNCVGYVRHVDCVFLTTDEGLVPDHVPYGPQTLVRVTVGKGYERPVYLHLFADHYRDPWYAHYGIGRNGAVPGTAVSEQEMLNSGESSPWSNLTPTIYQESGAALNFSLRHSYAEKAKGFRGTLEFGRSVGRDAEGRDASHVQLVKTFEIAAEPNGVVIIAPPDLETEEHVALLKRDREYAEETGAIADNFEWPKYGKTPAKIPMLVSAKIGGYDLAVDRIVTAREEKTLDYFGFNGSYERILHGLWFMREGSYCQPDLQKMSERLKSDVAEFRKAGRREEEIAALMLMDEPTGQTATFMATDLGYRQKFREWLRNKGLAPEDVLVESWEEVRPVAEGERSKFPALHYYTQLFRTRALGDFMAIQRKMIEQAYGREFPTLVNFSDGAVYHGNFCGQGVDYFELLDAEDQNGIWGEDWANNSSTYQCAGYNVALMQGAARKRGQSIGHYLIAHAGRTPWDLKTKAVSETARGVRMWMNYSYGPNWSSHEGGPAWKSHLWHHRPEMWRANAEITREIGAVEEWLLTARPQKAEVAILYSSASDIWTMPNCAYGFDRMHTWLGLTHAQVPVDVVSERDVAEGMLGNGYKVCYLSGPNLTQAAAGKLKEWVQSGGTLWLSAGAGARDEFDRPLEALTELIPAEAGNLETLEPYQSAGRFLNTLVGRDQVTWGEETLEVLSVKQRFVPGEGAEVFGTYEDGSAAVVSGRAGHGRVIASGFLPGLSYIQPALKARHRLEENAAKQAEIAKREEIRTGDQPEATHSTNALNAFSVRGDSGGESDRDLLARSYNPWSYPDGIRERLLIPVKEAGVLPRVSCDTPLVDVVALPCESGLLLAISNFSLQPVKGMRIEIHEGRGVRRIESVRHGRLEYRRNETSLVFEIPVEATDFVMVQEER